MAASPSFSDAQSRISALSIRNLDVSYGQAVALTAAFAEFPSGNLCAIAGPNGAGKSTLLLSALDLIPRQSGSVEVFGSSLSSQRHRIAFVPQRSSIDWDFPVSVESVVKAGLYPELGWMGRYRKHHLERVKRSLLRLGIDTIADRQIGQLSGGQQQRVFLARALVQEPDLMILDEPLAGIDATSEHAIVKLFKELKAAGKTIICVHHDLGSLSEIYDRVTLIRGGVVAEGPVATTFSAENIEATYGILPQSGLPASVHAAGGGSP